MLVVKVLWSRRIWLPRIQLFTRDLYGALSSNPVGRKTASPLKMLPFDETTESKQGWSVIRMTYVGGILITLIQSVKSHWNQIPGFEVDGSVNRKLSQQDWSSNGRTCETNSSDMNLQFIEAKWQYSRLFTGGGSTVGSTELWAPG